MITIKTISKKKILWITHMKTYMIYTFHIRITEKPQSIKIIKNSLEVLRLNGSFDVGQWM